MGKLGKVKNLSLVEAVTQKIEEAILSGEYKPGDRLPSTRDLQGILGVSLVTIRESLAILEQKGLLKARKGAKGGFFVREISTKPLTRSLKMLLHHMVLSHRELYEFRISNEAAVVRLVVQKADSEQIEIFKQFLEELKGCKGNGHEGRTRLVEIEQELRKEFLKAADNRIYDAVLIPIIDGLHQYAAQYLSEGGDRETQLACDHWEGVIQAIADRDEEGASYAVKKLLFQFRDLILETSEE